MENKEQKRTLEFMQAKNHSTSKFTTSTVGAWDGEVRLRRQYIQKEGVECHGGA